MGYFGNEERMHKNSGEHSQQRSGSENTRSSVNQAEKPGSADADLNGRDSECNHGDHCSGHDAQFVNRLSELSEVNELDKTSHANDPHDNSAEHGFA